jgi:hypothetical protein
MRNRPFIFATGYDSSGLPEEFREYPTLQKPFQIDMLATEIANVLNAPAAASLHQPRTFLTR